MNQEPFELTITLSGPSGVGKGACCDLIDKALQDSENPSLRLVPIRIREVLPHSGETVNRLFRPADSTSEGFRTCKLADIMKVCDEHAAQMDKIFSYCEDTKIITLNVQYPYDIEMSRIPSYHALLQWSAHLLQKNWVTTAIIIEFIHRVCSIKGWNLHSKNF